MPDETGHYWEEALSLELLCRISRFSYECPIPDEVIARSRVEPACGRSHCARRLFGALQYHLRQATAGPSSRPLQFVPGESEWAFLLDPVPVWKRTGFYVKGDGLLRLVDGVSAKVSDHSLHDGLVFFRSTLHPIV